MEDKYNKITNKSIKGLILINKRDEHSMLTIKELLDNNIISLEIIDKHVRIECLNKGIEPIINYENRLKYLQSIFLPECKKGTAKVISKLCE